MSSPLVLIADNDRAVSSLLGEVLARHGMRVVPAYDGAAACQVMRGAQVDVLVCDLDMPKMGGLEVLESMHAHGSAPATIVISGYLDAAIEQRLAALPCVRQVLRKPFDLFVFAGLVRELADAVGAQGPPAAEAPVPLGAPSPSPSCEGLVGEA